MHPPRARGGAAAVLLVAALALSGVLPARPPVAGTAGRGDLGDVPWAGGALASWTRGVVAAGASRPDTPEGRDRPSAPGGRPRPGEACCSSSRLVAGVAAGPADSPRTAPLPSSARGVRLGAVYVGPTAPPGGDTLGLTATGGVMERTDLASASHTSGAGGGESQPGTGSVSPVPVPTDPAPPTAEAFSFAPNPIAATGALVPGQTVMVAVYAADGRGSPVPGALVYLSFVAAPGGGAAAVGGTVLGAVPEAFVADGAGTVTVTYTAPAALPARGADTLTAANGGAAPTASGTDSYRFASPDLTTATGSGGGGLQVVTGSEGGIGLVVALRDGRTAVYLLAPNVTVTQDGEAAALEDLAPGDPLVLTLNRQNQVTAIDVPLSEGGGAGGGSSSPGGLSPPALQGAASGQSSSQGS
jgi:hypothetical protein